MSLATAAEADDDDEEDDDDETVLVDPLEESSNKRVKFVDDNRS